MSKQGENKEGEKELSPIEKSRKNLELGKWKKGQSGNPKGRPRNLLKNLESEFAAIGGTETELSRADKFAIVERVLELPLADLERIAKSPKTPVFLVAIISAIVKDIKAGRIYTLDSVFDRLFGKAKQTTALTSEEGAGVRFMVEIVKPENTKE